MMEKSLLLSIQRVLAKSVQFTRPHQVSGGYLWSVTY
uniref:Uncharacterized protein n=1 Tax=Anguilla anguilla TaxID=7936 RepID=A0A0E9S565_ANGAN